jgi:hypothetical protein
VTTMAAQEPTIAPGGGLVPVAGGEPVSVRGLDLDDTAVRLYRNLLLGGEPGQGKSSLADWWTVRAALGDDHDPVRPAVFDAKGGGDADPGR